MSEELYQQTILEHARRPHALPAGADQAAEVDNPFCGDNVTVGARVHSGKFVELGWEGEGCALMKASATMMCELAPGRSIEEIESLRARLEMLLNAKSADLPAELAAFAGVAAHPSRRKCVTLPWDAVQKIIASSSDGGGGGRHP